MWSEWTGEIDASFARAVSDRLDEIAALGAERRSPDAPWNAAAAVEERMLDGIDRLLGLEGSADRIVAEARRVAEGGGDARRAYAVGLVLGSAATEEAVEAAVSMLRTPRADLRAAAAEALSLAQSPRLAAAVLRLLRVASAEATAAALAVLRFRREATFVDSVLLLGHPDAQVAGAAARGLGVVAEQKAAGAVLRRVLLEDPEEPLAVAAAESLVALGDPAGVAFVRGELEAESASPSLSDEVRVAYLRLLSLGGEALDLELFFRSLEPSPRDATAVGWFGHPDLCDWLLGSLEAAAEARRTGGRGGRAPASIAASSFEVAAAAALSRIAGSPETMPQVFAEAAAWRSWWSRARARLAPGQRYRFGRPYSPDATIEELGGDASRAARADAALELAIVTAGGVALETGDWVRRQREGIAQAKRAVAGPWPPGAFPGRRGGR